MRFLIISALCYVMALCTGCSNVSCPSRDITFEHYCDSVWNNNPNYYNDVLSETDKYQLYIKQHGSWWAED